MFLFYSCFPLSHSSHKSQVILIDYKNYLETLTLSNIHRIQVPYHGLEKCVLVLNSLLDHISYQFPFAIKLQVHFVSPTENSSLSYGFVLFTLSTFSQGKLLFLIQISGNPPPVQAVTQSFTLLCFNSLTSIYY